MSKNIDINQEKEQQILRGKRIKYIRENELHLYKTELSKLIGISSQFLGLVEEGKGNLTYRSLKLFRDLSGHSSDYILYGLDDTVLNETKKYLEYFSEENLICGLNILKDIAYLIKNQK